MKIKEDLLLPVWVLFLILFRPSVFGERYNSLIFLFFFVVTVMILAIESQKHLGLNRRRVLLMVVVYICITYFFIQGLILSDARATVINSCSFLVMLIPCLVLVLSNHQEKVLKLFINFHYILSWSAVITFCIFIFLGLSIDALPVLANLDSRFGLGVSDPSVGLVNHLMFFPFTICWSLTGLFGYDIPRFTGIYREPGMAQIFFLTALMLTYFVDVKNYKLKRIILFVGSLLTFSASGLANLAICMLFLTVFNASVKRSVVGFIRKPWVLVFGLLVFVVVVRFAINMVMNKLGEVSGEGRLESFAEGLRLLSQNLAFGDGYYNSFRKDEGGVVISNSFIGIPGVSYQLGLVGLFLYFLCWYLSLRYLSNRRAFCIYIPCLLTLMLSQPSYNDAFSWFVLFLDTRNFSPNS